MPWQDFGYQDASFRGVGFFVREHGQEAARRIAAHEYPLRDSPYTEDLGRKIETYRVDAYLIGETCLIDAARLYQACIGKATPGTLVHPYLGTLNVRCASLSRKEGEREGNIVRFALSFIEAGLTPSPSSSEDTSASLLQRAGAVLSALASNYATVMSFVRNPALLLDDATAILGEAATQMLGLPAGALYAVAGEIGGLTADVSESTATGLAATGAFDLYAATVTSAAPGAYAPGADMTYGLGAIASGFAAMFPAPSGATPLRVQQGANRAALTSLIAGAATAAVAEVFAQTTFFSASAATAARGLLVGLIDAATEAASDAGDDALYGAWLDLSAAAIADLTARAQNLPSLGSYALPSVTPSLYLAHRLYQDATRADELAALADAVHPGFLAASGPALFP